MQEDLAIRCGVAAETTFSLPAEPVTLEIDFIDFAENKSV